MILVTSIKTLFSMQSSNGNFAAKIAICCYSPYNMTLSSFMCATHFHFETNCEGKGSSQFKTCLLKHNYTRAS